MGEACQVGGAEAEFLAVEHAVEGFGGGFGPGVANDPDGVEEGVGGGGQQGGPTAVEVER